MTLLLPPGINGLRAFVICDSQEKYNSQNLLGTAVETWCLCLAFTLTNPTAHALITTLRATLKLIQDLIIIKILDYIHSLEDGILIFGT